MAEVSQLLERRKQADEQHNKLMHGLGEVALALTALAEVQPPEVKKPKQKKKVTSFLPQEKNGKLNERPIREWALKIFQEAKKPLDSSDVAIQMMKEGYKSKSTKENFIKTVYVTGIAALLRQNILEAVGERPNVRYQMKKRSK